MSRRIYRRVFSGPGWRLVKRIDRRLGRGRSCWREQKGPPLWVRIRSTPDSTATLVELAGAVVDYASARPAS